MKTVELFSGIGGFRVAAEKLHLRTVWANDCCPKAGRVYRDQFGSEEFHEGDINILATDIPAHDLLTAGFPCQPFSSAGKKEGIRDPRGTLFSTVIEVLQEHRPKFFVLENVKRLLTMESGAHFATILASLANLDYRIEWRLLNATNFSLPQNRHRVFIVGIRRKGQADQKSTSRGTIRLANPQDFRKSKVDPSIVADTTQWNGIGDHGRKFPNWGLAECGRFYGGDLDEFHATERKVLLREFLEQDVSHQFDFTESTVRRIKESKRVTKFIDGVEILVNQAGGARMGYTVFGINGLSPTLTSTASRHYERYAIDGRYRRLTNVEYARLQGFPDDHCECVSIYDQYALYGNAVPPPMALWVLRQMLSSGTAVEKLPRKRLQRKLFADA
ncbi:MAG: DNA (cytosine-5-)-methyltransferase [Planctomycetia bacterium]|nr:DNA (cytosine-5-)-methyltransferase [Planctomycetia bacterium]